MEIHVVIFLLASLIMLNGFQSLCSMQLPVPLLKEKIANVTGVVSEQQRLICRGKVLKDDELLSAYRILLRALNALYVLHTDISIWIFNFLRIP